MAGNKTAVNRGPKSNEKKTVKSPASGITLLSSPDNSTIMTRGERDEVLMETLKREDKLPLLSIIKSSISLYSWEEMTKIGTIKVTIPSLYGLNSVNDPRMGVVSLSSPCQHCGQIDCPGHYGLIEFGGAIYNPAYIGDVVSVLTCVCNDCGGLLITEDVMRQQGLMKLSYDKRLSALKAFCKDHECLRQKLQKGLGEITPCEKNPLFSISDNKENGEIVYKNVEKGNKKTTADNPVQVIQIGKVIKILEKISASDSVLLGFPTGTRPENMIMRGILVPPVIARPPVIESGVTYEDQLSQTYVNIVREVNKIKNKGVSYSELFKQVKELIFKTEGKKLGSKDFLSIIERFQGKTALLRGLLMGKRNDFSARTVAGPDPSLKFGQIRIPEVWASELTKRVLVTSFNINILSELLSRSRITHITPFSTGLRKYYDEKSRSSGTNPPYKLKIGDIVERWLQNGDRVVDNRQPTLHRQSMMGYEVILGPQLTIGLHLSYTTPMNCDFDGDENNIWQPQDFEVEAEVDILMNVKNNIMSSEQNRPIMGLVMNSITGAFLITNPTTIINDILFKELYDMIEKRKDLLTLYERLIKYGVNPRSGKAIFSALFPEDFYYNYKGVVINEGILISGRLKKSHVGPSNRSIIQDLYKKYGSERTSTFFTEAPWIINKWLIEVGFTVGMNDIVNLDNNGNDKSEKILNEELAKIYTQLDALGGKLEDPVEEDERQRQINNLVNSASGIGLRLAKEILSKDNAIGVMTEEGAGTKGSNANVGQMFGSVSQQYYHGERLKPTLTNNTRLLPTYDVNDNSAEANAFISESFYTGLSPEGLFFLQAAGREGLLDTALKTAETGSMHHRMMKAFENVVIGYDGSIRNTIGTMFSPLYNSGYDVAEMLSVDVPSKPTFSSFVDIKGLASELNIKRGWVTTEINNSITKNRTYLENLPKENILPVNNNPSKSPPTSENDQFPIEMPSRNKITKFEKARIIGTRAKQLSNNSAPLIKLENISTDLRELSNSQLDELNDRFDPVKIAKMEYEAGLLDLYIVRKFSDGSYKNVQPTKENI